MGTNTMGKVVVSVKIENLEDQYKAHQGLIPPDQIRALIVDDAVVDTGATGLMIPARLIAALGLRPTETRPGRTVSGPVTIQKYEAVRLHLQGRRCVVDVHEIPDHSPILIGQIPLEAMDWVVDPKNRRVIGNPEHGGEEMVECY